MKRENHRCREIPINGIGASRWLGIVQWCNKRSGDRKPNVASLVKMLASIERWKIAEISRDEEIKGES